MMRSTKILMTADTVGGVWVYALELAQALTTHSCEVALAAMGGYLSSSQVREAARIPHLTVYESDYKLEWMDDPWTDVDEAGAWLLALGQEVQPDVVHLNNYVHGALPWSAPVLMVGHSCVLSWWQAVKGEAAPAEWETYRQRVRQGLRAADLVVAPTHAMLAALQRHYGPLPTTQVIHNERSAHRFTLGAKEPFILAIGRLWDEAKNVQALDRIAPELSWPVFIAGQDEHPEGRQVRFQNVASLGRLDSEAVWRWLARAGIYALPARYEPFGLSVLEAAMAGCALLLGDIPSLRELWDEAACFVPPDDEAALSAALQRLAADGELRGRLALAARQRSRRFSAHTMGAAYWLAYQTLHTDAVPAARKPQPGRERTFTYQSPLFPPQAARV